MPLSGKIAHVLHELEEVPFHELEHKEELVVFSDDFLQLDDVGVAQLLQGLDLSELHALFPAAICSGSNGEPDEKGFVGVRSRKHERWYLSFQPLWPARCVRKAWYIPIVVKLQQ